MKTKFNATLTATAAAIATVLSLTAPAKANEVDELIKALAPFMPEVDGEVIDTNNNIVNEFGLNDVLRLNVDVNDLEIAYLGEAAGQVQKLRFSSNSSNGIVFDDIRSLAELYDAKGQGKVGTFDVQENLNSRWLQVGTTTTIGSFSAGDTLDFTLSDFTDPSDTGVSSGADSANFRAYTVAGLENWLVLGIEDTKGEYSDWDFNDTVVAIKLGEKNISDVPEPATTIALFGVAAAGLGLTRRKNAAK